VRRRRHSLVGKRCDALDAQSELWRLKLFNFLWYLKSHTYIRTYIISGNIILHTHDCLGGVVYWYRLRLPPRRLELKGGEIESRYGTGW
jgi:hypothetical protein